MEMSVSLTITHLPRDLLHMGTAELDVTDFENESEELDARQRIFTQQVPGRWVSPLHYSHRSRS